MVNRDPGLTDASRRVLFELESYANPDGTKAHPSVLGIALNLRTSTGSHGHVSEKTVRTALRDGVGRGYIELTHKARRVPSGGLADEYRLTLPDTAYTLGWGVLDCVCAVAREEQRTKRLIQQQNQGSPVTAATGEPGSAVTAITGEPTVSPVISDHFTGNPAQFHRQQLLPNTRSFPPVLEHQKAGSLVGIPDAGASATAPEGEQTDLEWLSTAVAGLDAAELATATEQLATGNSRYAVAAHIRTGRKRRA
ncbi:hypothetical protein [Rhodococcus sp. HNM0569]|uniref:hypothetical protein n=1 Tax=Rhodococcus sp. HNM0569 TaxID=2716340 RepID=UPI00146D0A94|nr:hypothetical protein [Rhodococcus sp. HNM0569]NLU81622.1 hypothetical protein [Rhodococcus sp. HNM0569]